jgi:hypothetical protein
MASNVSPLTEVDTLLAAAGGNVHLPNEGPVIRRVSRPPGLG